MIRIDYTKHGRPYSVQFTGATFAEALRWMRDNEPAVVFFRIVAINRR